MTITCTVIVTAALASMSPHGSTFAPVTAAGGDVFAKTKGVDAGLKSYADTGTVDYEFGPAKSPAVSSERMTRMKMSPMFGTAAAIGVLAFGLSQTVPAAATQPDVFAKSKAVYASLKSYADTGSVDYEFGPAKSPSREHHTFRTFYRAPREFFFDFVKQQHADRFVIWSDAEAFHTWWQATGGQGLYPKGQGAGAFANAATPTSHAVMMIAPLLFAQAGLAGTLTELADIKAAGTETVNGRPCQKLVGVAKSVYAATGRETNIRPTTVWIDAETLLVRRVFEDSPRGSAASDVLRFTTTFAPVANPAVDDAQFKFMPPFRR